MKKILTVCLLTTALCGATNATTIWSEDFSTYVDVGITGLGPTNGYPGSVTKWSIDVSNCTLADAADYFLAVDTSGGRMEAVDIDGEAVWTSESIDISEYSNVAISVDTSETGSSTSASKYVRLYYKLNGGAEIAFAVNPTNSGNWAAATATQSGLSGSTVQIVARVNNPYSTNASIFDNVTVTGDLGTPGNSAPVLAAIGNQAVVVSNELSFTISATDINGDDIVLSATGLPGDAVFNTVTNAGSVSNTFSWASAAPVGVYTSVFTAADGTTNVSETITITVSEPSVLMLTEIGDPDMVGGQNYRFVEIYNNGNDAIDLTAENWFLCQQINGGLTWDDIALTGTVAAAETYVIAFSTTNFQAAYGFTPDQTDNGIDGTGDDAYFLYSGGDHSSGTLVDIYGVIDEDGTGMAWEYTDSRANRNATASGPTPVWISSQWDITNGAQTNDMNPGIAYDQPPVLNPIGPQGGLEDNTITFSVTASDPADNDTITLSATNLPSGAVFTNGTFTWENASPSGDYNVTFFATDADGSVSEVVTISVIAKPLLLISEVADPAGTGGGDYRFVELWNAGTNTIDLAADSWTLSMQDNGDTNDWRDVALTGSIGPTGTYIVAYSSTNFLAAYGFEPNQEAANVIEGNGRDTYALFYGGDHSAGLLIDIYGEIDVDGLEAAWNYEDDRAERNNPVLEPNTTWTASEWTLSVFTYTNEFNPGVHGPTPEFIPALENQEVILGSNLTLTVTATNVVYTNEVITLSATVLPDGATFSTTEGTGTVSSVLNWTPVDTGYYNVTFAAEGIVDTTTESITIHVISLEQPVMNLTMPAGGPITIAWPITAGSSFNVLTNSDLLNTNGWGYANLTPFLDGDSYKVTNSIGSDTSLFYKLEAQ